MAGHWIFQGNPNNYDIEGALGVLSEIRWRVPQYTGAITPGDEVVIWRSGADAGIVGVGRIMSYPGALRPGTEEDAFDRGDIGPARETTRVVLAVRPARFVPKRELARHSQLADHQIMTAPMGTVFPLTDPQWAVLQGLVPAPPAADMGAEEDRLPPPFAWEQRGKDTYPMPGGYQGYLDSARRILQHVAVSSPDRETLEHWVRETLNVSESNARLGVGFFRRTGLLLDRGATLEVGSAARRYLDTGDPAPVIALLHSRIRFIGEMLAEAREPISDSELLDRANRYYGFSWDTKAQIRRRRGWLESAGLLTETEVGLVTTDAGRELLERLDLQPRATELNIPQPLPVPPQLKAEQVVSPTSPTTESNSADDRSDALDAFIDRLITSSTDSGNPEQFEIETAEAFDRLGFQAEWVGGSGKTDVLLVADLGKGHSYRVVVDCKSTGRGAVSAQIDWDTIDEHRHQHDAEHAAIVAPAFGGGRLAGRATRHGTVMLTVDDLAELLRQHRRTPLGLDTYRLLFTSDSAEDGIAAIGEHAAEAQRWGEIVRLVIDLLVKMTPRMGALSARDLHLLFASASSDTEATEVELDTVLSTLASPIMAVCQRVETDRYRLTRRPMTGAHSVEALAAVIRTAGD